MRFGYKYQKEKKGKKNLCVEKKTYWLREQREKENKEIWLKA